ncbi:MAG: hypothetical protein LBK07_01275 [Tannerella sp.]|jgi:hypothetical protein|nr:hypothetical protein [Tannerella sp.]
MINELGKIENLLNRFFEGETSGEEEQALYRFFRRDDVPEHLACYKPVFEYFETGLVEEWAAVPAVEGRTSLRISLKRPAIWAISAAAVLAGCIFGFSRWQAEAFDPYEGSYIVRGGVRITDTRRIRSELEKTLREALERQADMERLISDPAGPDDVFDRYRQVREQQQNAILSGFTDPYARKAAEKILMTDFD